MKIQLPTDSDFAGMAHDVAMTDLLAAYEAYLRVASSPRTVQSRIEFLARADTELLPYGLDEANADELADLLGSSGWSDWTRRTYFNHLNGYYQWAVRRHELTYNPCSDLAAPPPGESVPDPVTDHELAQALLLSPDQPWRLAVLLAAYAGLRAGEIASIRRENITEERVHVIRGKGRKSRYVPTGAHLWDEVRDRPAGPLVHSPRGFALTAHSLSTCQRLHWRRIGMPQVHLHRFRHWFGTALLRNGADLRTVQELMGHESILTTQGYTKVVSEQRERAIRSLPAIMTRGPDVTETDAPTTVSKTGPASL